MSKKVDRFNRQLCENILAYFSSYAEAEQTVLALSQAGFDDRKLSIIGKEYQLAKCAGGSLAWEHPAQAEVTGGGYWGSCVGGLLGILAGISELFHDGSSWLVVIYPIMGVLLGSFVAATIIGFAGVFGNLQMPQARVLNSEARVPADNFIIWVSGSSEDVRRSKQMLDQI